jgi:hypothetical protein
MNIQSILWSVIQEYGPLNKDRAQFFISELRPLAIHAAQNQRCTTENENKLNCPY